MGKKLDEYNEDDEMVLDGLEEVFGSFFHFFESEDQTGEDVSLVIVPSSDFTDCLVIARSCHRR